MLRDRGSIKWTAMMLPEQVKALRQFDWEQEKKVKPELDEQQLEMMEETICEAMEHHLELCFTYFDQEEFHLLIGKVHFVDVDKKELRILDFHGDVNRLKIRNLADVKIR
ncbi:YolD-like protein [Fictibacillus solisalsi]|uniref:YolD-like protein n=1 Tax=Fictibacillus solisalsi TaxID=459525 RepID=A0A1G9WKM6_9BACL|nr:YolD-like family protein [Fictibacillus solisalsi]SDM84595.1 YolD-like protein [Fictibacillus solisalsi]